MILTMKHLFFDLCVKDKACLDACWDAGYNVVAQETEKSLGQALNMPEQVGQQSVSADVLSVINISPTNTRTKRCSVLNRLTVVLDSLKNLDALKVKLGRLRQYDILAVTPTDAHTFQYACEKLDIDLISIDTSVELSFQLKSNFVQTAIRRGILFELQYSTSFLNCSSKKVFLSAVMAVVRVTRGGSGIIFSSGCISPFDIRKPDDVNNLGNLCGIKNEDSKLALLTSNPLLVVARGVQRRLHI